MSTDAIQINALDNVATAIKDLPAGRAVKIGGGRETFQVTAREAIRAGHKLALGDIRKGGTVIKYGETIGLAATEIAIGSHVHVHNVEGRRGRGDRQ
jgi:altronate dehydratase small subunit